MKPKHWRVDVYMTDFDQILKAAEDVQHFIGLAQLSDCPRDLLYSNSLLFLHSGASL